MPLLVQDLPEAQALSERVAQKLGVSPAEIRSIEIVRRALDARPRIPVWRLNLKVEVENEAEVLARKPGGVRLFTERDRLRVSGELAAPKALAPSGLPVVVIGAGPAGLFAALRLGEAGVSTILLERGGAVEARVPAVNKFWRGGELNPESNILFGEGGAGTFSDGKIYTRRRDGELGWIFKVLVEAGADPGILTESYPHLGTDKVRAVLPVLRNRLQKAGVEVRFDMRVERLVVEGGKCTGVELGDGTVLKARAVIAGPGHSARDTIQMLVEAGAQAEVRPIAVGARIEHLQSLVDTARYPKGRGELPPASYRLAHSPKGGRAGWTFCMCPGGMVVPAMHQPGTVVVNGMSFAARRAIWANSAVIVQALPADYGGMDALCGFAYQAEMERRAFKETGGYAAPAQRVPDFLQDVGSKDLPKASYPLGILPIPLKKILPEPIITGMKEAILCFERDIPGFSKEGVLIAPESRTTAPLRFLRGKNLESTLPGLYPVGEGAGYAGGIISAALDGFRAAESLIAVFSATLSR
jgi:uncharacterized FAD-dependent dehydrogenase